MTCGPLYEEYTSINDLNCHVPLKDNTNSNKTAVFRKYLSKNLPQT